jgi:F-type H+-transporting ATPase subunit gamma
MANVLDLRRRIRSVKNTRQITKAMKMVSAAKLRRAQERAMSARPYARMITSVLESLKRRTEIYDPITGDIRHPLLVTRPEKTVMLVVVSGDKGFAGAFNSNIIKASFNFISEKKDLNLDIEAIGRKGRDQFRRQYPLVPYPATQSKKVDEESQEAEEVSRPERRRSAQVEITGDHPGMLQELSFERVSDLAREIVSRYVHEEIDACYLVYNEFKSVLQQRVVVERLLPILEIGQREVTTAQEMTQEERERAGHAAISAGVSLSEADTREPEEEAKHFGTAEVDYIYEQPPSELFAGLLPMYISSQLYHAMLESVAAEHAARMTAMDSATNNASEMIDSLTLTMNRVRQAAITKEIIEIVSGAAAL